MTLSRNELTDALIAHGYWLPSNVPGVWGRTERFEAILDGFDALVSEIARRAGAERVSFPPVIEREVIRQTGYMESFPELCGSIHSYREERGRHMDLVDQVEAGNDWTDFLEPMPVTLCPAACYPLYPTLSGPLPDSGREFDLTSYVFRAEPSDDPARLQSFRMHENVRIGRPDEVRRWRDDWADRGRELLLSLGLEADLAAAADPFFGRGGKMLAANQIAEGLKVEISVPITSTEEPTAVASFNYHEDKFGRTYGIELSDGNPAHTACIGFGLERVTLALIATHGIDVRGWPVHVREQLSL